MKKNLLTIQFLLASYALMAQSGPVTLSSERQNDKSVVIKYEKTTPGTYTVLMDFTRLENVQQPLGSFSITGTSGVVTSLRPLDQSRGVSYSYRYRAIRGKLKPSIDENFAYLLPYPDNTKVMIRESSFLRSTLFGQETPEDWKAYRFYTSEQLPVTAMRKGIVVAVDASYEDADPEKVQYSSKRNYIIVEHPDGTLVRYSSLKHGSIPVKVGDTVYPGDVLGENLQTNNRGYNVSVVLYYLKTDGLDAYKKGQAPDFKGRHGYLAPKFLTKSGVDYLQKNQQYTATSTPETLQKEMSKREIKRLKKK